ncbi:MAG: ribose-5-phosphate isomerase ribose 5-phosphate isomerase [Candidatus Taylorbacteria bacterium]|nr:ribose-5-phosphate isomerase ribose 5-phosphate isomerase [Candidatus Taylorbacteria bacterium]
MSKIFFASDHAGFELKKVLVEYARSLGFDAIDKGNTTFEALDDYPDFISLAAKEVSNDPYSKGVVIGGSGQGEAIVANRFPNVRAALWYGGNAEIIKLSREHNDANVLSLGARFVNTEEAKEALKTWLDTPFSGDERHQRRIDKIENLNK